MSGLEQEFPGRVVSRNEDATTPEIRPRMQDLGFQNHGLVIRSSNGDVLWSQPDHEVKIEDVRSKLGELLQAR